tara:strand:+ start:2453 stop:4006 length:1554 start_codon:yes stop_codon:yes gene_type:complete
MKLILSYFGWLSLALGVAALFMLAVVPNQTTAIWSLTGGSLISLLGYCASNWKNVYKNMTGRTAIYGANAVFITLVFVGILIFINLLAAKHGKRFDFTESGIFTLSLQTKKIVSTLPRKVKMTAFFQNESPEKTQFKNLTDGYLELTNKLDLEFIDPDKNPAITKRYGIKTYGTVVLESGENETKIPRTAEEDLTNAIRKVIQDEKKIIYFLEGHGERSIDKTEKDDYSNVKQSLEKDGHSVKKLLLLQTGKIPVDANLLIIPGPLKPLLKEEIELIDTYLENGGAVFLMIDPESQIELDAFLLKWGIVLNDDLIIDPLSKLFGGDVAAPVIANFANHGITKDFALRVIMPLLRSVKAKPHEDIKTIDLIKTEANSWAETNYKEDKIKFDQTEDTPGPIVVGVVATRDLKIEENTQSDHESEKKKPNAQARLTVIGDSDFASNTYFNFSGNGDFFLNVASWMVEEENLVSIRPKKRRTDLVQLSQVQGSLIFMSVVIGFPAIVLVAGFRVWWRRRAL